MDRGFIKLWRCSLESPVFTNENLFKLWTLCLFKANFKRSVTSIPGILEPITLDRGQFVTGRFSLHAEFYGGRKRKDSASPQTVWRWLQTLEKMQNLNIKTYSKYSVITIHNWDTYQCDEQQTNNRRTTDEQHVNTEKNVKNVKNVKNEKKKDICSENQKNVAAELIRIVSQRRAIKVTPSQAGVWSNTIRLMETRDNIAIDDMVAALSWYEENWRNEFVPVIESACSLRDKWQKLLNAIERDKKNTAKDNHNGFDQRDYQKHATQESDIPDFLR